MQHLGKIIMAIGLFFVLSLVLGKTVKAQTTSAPTTSTPPAVICDLSKLTPPVKNESWFLPDCVYFEGTQMQKQCGCRNINVFIQLLINIANKLLLMVGAVAFLMFIYGGFLFLTSAGGDNVKKGKETLIAATIGLIIIFSAQLLLNFVLDIVINKAAKEIGGSATLNGVQINAPSK